MPTFSYIVGVAANGEEKEKSQEERLRDLARWIQAQPWNAPETDKTWVFEVWRAKRELREAFVRSNEGK